MKAQQMVTSILTVLTFTITAPAEQYEWGRVYIGGGGYQTGVVSHAKTPGLLYLKGDVMGLHRRMPGESRWYQTADGFSPDDGRINGCGGVGLHPEHSAIVYTTFGDRQYSGNGGLYKSTDYGVTWERVVSFYEQAAGGDERKWANNVAVDPNNGDIVYVGTREDGLIRTIDGGRTFDHNPHPDIPVNPDTAITYTDPKKDTHKDSISGHVGSRNVVIDPSETLTNPTRSKTLYIGAYTRGVYRSTDGGEHFSLMPGSPVEPRWMKLAANGTLYVVNNHGGGLWKYDGTWSLVKEGDYRALALDPFDAEGKRLIICDGHVYYRTVDGGATWDTLKQGSGWIDVHPPDWDLRTSGKAVSSIDFDLSTPDRLYQCDAFGVWVADNPWATPIQWRPMHEGCEGTVSFGISCPPDNGNPYPLYSGGSDANNYAHRNPTEEYPDDKLAPVEPPEEGTQWLAYCSDYDFCMMRPDVMYRVVQAHNRRQYVCKTTNGGRTAADWTVIASSHKDSPLPSPVSWNGRTHKLAVSATDPDACFMAGRSGYGNYYTLDGGTTWTRQRGVLPDDQGFIKEGGWSMYGRDKPVCADRVNGNYIYGYLKKKFYRSDGKGANATWTNPYTFENDRDPSTWKLCAYHLQAAPDHAGHLVLNLGRNGLWLTTDHGDSWRKIAAVADCRSCGWGKKAPDSEYSTIYIHAKIDGQWGIHRSTDLAQSWDKITPDHISFNIGSNITGDLQTYGTVYMSEDARGIVYGKIVDRSTTTIGGRIGRRNSGPMPRDKESVQAFDIRGRRLPAAAVGVRSMAGGVVAIDSKQARGSRLILRVSAR